MPPDKIMARLLHRDADLLVVDKPAGIAVHASPRSPGRETITGWLEHLRFGLPRRPEIAHRLDRETSGCLVLGRHRQALIRLGELFRTGAVEKSYWALVEGGPETAEGEIDLALARRSADPRDWRMRVHPTGDPSLTRWRVLGRAGELAWLELAPVTGRTHQLRVHCAASGWPILGDRVYGRGEPAAGLMLHARRVAVSYRPKRAPVVAEAPAPEPFAAALKAFGVS